MSSIANIDMDYFGCTTGRIATKNIRPCICFVVIFEGGMVFLEHRSDIFLPQNFTIETTKLVFQNLAEHIDESKPSSRIT
jgi:hypothetical protein